MTRSSRRPLLAAGRSRSRRWRFAATLILLFGLLSLVQPSPRRDRGGLPDGDRSPDRPRHIGVTAGSGPFRLAVSVGVRFAVGLAGRRVAVGVDALGLAVGRSRPRRCRATSPTARSTATAPPRPSSTASRGPSSPPATTPTRTAPPTSSATATTRPGAGFLDRTRPAAGNHDWETKDLAGYLGYFGTAAAPNGVSWYSYDLGTWHVDRPRLRLLGRSAAATRTPPRVAGSPPTSRPRRARCTLAIWHHPRFSSGEHGNDRDGRAVLARPCTTPARTSSINGHDHDYERFAPQDPDGARGPACAASASSSSAPAARSSAPFATTAAEQRAARSVTVTGSSGSTCITASYDWRFIPTAGDVERRRERALPLTYRHGP